MPQIDFSPQHKINKMVDFDRLKLKKDDKARILLLERPTFAWTHTLRAPKIVNDKAVKVWKDGRRGEKYEDFDMDFIARPLCLGDLNILADKGVDGKNCPACEASLESEQVPPPERRFGMNVIRYATNREGKLLKPFQAACVVWTFAEKTYNKLVDIATEADGIIGRDLIIGPCINESFQNYENYLPSNQSVYTTDEATKNLIDEIYAQNRVEDLEAACGRRVERKWMANDIKQVNDRWAIANGDTGTDTTAAAAVVADELGAILAEAPKPAPSQAALPDLASLLDSPPASRPAKAPGTDFDDLLSKFTAN